MRKVFEETYAINAAIVILTKYLTFLTEYPYPWMGPTESDRALYWQGVNVLLQFLNPITPKIAGELLELWNESDLFQKYRSSNHQQQQQHHHHLQNYHFIPLSLADSDNANVELNRPFPLLIQVNGSKVKQLMVPRHDLENLYKSKGLADFALSHLDSSLISDDKVINRVIIPTKFHKSFLVNFVVLMKDTAHLIKSND